MGLWHIVGLSTLSTADALFLTAALLIKLRKQVKYTTRRNNKPAIVTPIAQYNSVSVILVDVERLSVLLLAATGAGLVVGETVTGLSDG